MAKTNQNPVKEKVAVAKGPELPGAFQLFKPSWEAFGLNWKAFILPWLLPLAILAIIMAMVGFAIPELQNQLRLQNPDEKVGFNDSRGVVLNVISAVLGSAAALAVLIMVVAYMYYLKVQSAKGIKVQWWTAFKASLHYFWRLLGLGILRTLIIGAGFILLIVPGLFMWRRYMLAPYYLIDQDIGVMEALRRSAADSKPFSSALWGMIGVYVLLSALGQIPLIGLLTIVASIAYSCAAALRYFQIKAAK